MKGKKKDRKKVGKIILLAMSFVMTVVLTFTITLAWFYDSDWASNSVTMAGSVGIELQDDKGAIEGGTGAGQLHFLINGDYAYPGQAIDVRASVFNNGGKSASGVSAEDLATSGKGSACYIRAQFSVYTDIGFNESGDSVDQSLNARYLYDFLFNLIEVQNSLQTSSGYKWVYYQNPDSHMKLDDQYWYNGVSSTTQEEDKADTGYFYLCNDGEDSKVLKILSVGEKAAFLWNNTIVIPWQLTNASADKNIFIGVTFQAIQTFIPIIEDGAISKLDNNQLDANLCTYDSIAVQTVFNSCRFTPIDLVVNGIDFGNGSYGSVSNPSGTTATSNS